MVRIGGKSDSANSPMILAPRFDGMFIAFEDKDTAALAHDESVALCIERSACVQASSLLVDRGFIELKPPIPIGQIAASAPPVSHHFRIAALDQHRGISDRMA